MFELGDFAKYEKWLFHNTLSKEEQANYKIDYSYKSDIIKRGLHKEVSNFRRFYRAYLASIVKNENHRACIDTEILNSYLESIYRKCGVGGIVEAQRIQQARYKKISRLKKRVGNIISEPSFFITLTFRDDILDSTKPHIRRKYVQRFLKKYSLDYVGNIDFGGKNGREHYHAVIMCERIDPKSWKYGRFNFEKITYKNNETLAKYIVKLSNHAIKETTKRNTLLYPKNFS